MTIVKMNDLNTHKDALITSVLSVKIVNETEPVDYESGAESVPVAAKGVV